MNIEKEIRESVWNIILRDSLHTFVLRSVGDSVWSSVYNSTYDSVKNSVWTSVYDSMETFIKDEY